MNINITSILEDAFSHLSTGMSTNRIYPVIKPKDFLNYNEVFKFAMENLYTPYNSELVIAYALDREYVMSFVTKRELEEMQLTLPELHEIAMANFLRDKDIPMRKVKIDGQRMYVYGTGDCYGATRLLLNHRIQEVVDKFKGRAILSIPNRDRLFIMANNKPCYKLLKQLTETEYSNGLKPITQKIYTLNKGTSLNEKDKTHKVPLEAKIL